jgi:hypothetical protein
MLPQLATNSGCMVILLAVAVQISMADQIKREVTRQECRESTASDKEVVVCSRRRERQKYRLPGSGEQVPLEHQRPNSVRERARWIEGGESGTNSCGPVGPGGWTGCQQQRVRKARQQKKGWYGV